MRTQLCGPSIHSIFLKTTSKDCYSLVWLESDKLKILLLRSSNKKRICKLLKTHSKRIKFTIKTCLIVFKKYKAIPMLAKILKRMKKKFVSKNLSFLSKRTNQRKLSQNPKKKLLSITPL